jgi:hypothetical protein
MAYTQTHLEALETALARGEKQVRYEDKLVEYRSVEELKLAIAEVKRGLFEQARATGLWPRAARQIRITTTKGM